MKQKRPTRRPIKEAKAGKAAHDLICGRMRELEAELNDLSTLLKDNLVAQYGIEEGDEVEWANGSGIVTEVRANQHTDPTIRVKPWLKNGRHLSACPTLVRTVDPELLKVLAKKRDVQPYTRKARYGSNRVWIHPQ